jgi:hypothetical protein
MQDVNKTARISSVGSASSLEDSLSAFTEIRKIKERKAMLEI